MKAHNRKYECEKCDGGVLSREHEHEHFTCENCGAVVAPEIAKLSDRVQ